MNFWALQRQCPVYCDIYLYRSAPSAFGSNFLVPFDSSDLVNCDSLGNRCYSLITFHIAGGPDITVTVDCALKTNYRPTDYGRKPIG